MILCTPLCLVHSCKRCHEMTTHSTRILRVRTCCQPDTIIHQKCRLTDPQHHRHTESPSVQDSWALNDVRHEPISTESSSVSTGSDTHWWKRVAKQSVATRNGLTIASQGPCCGSSQSNAEGAVCSLDIGVTCLVGGAARILLVTPVVVGRPCCVFLRN